MDCTPNDKRLTPAARKAASNGSVTVSGLHSTVTSQPSARSTDSRIDTSSSDGSNEGVPPPKNTLVAEGRAAPASSARQAATYDSINPWRSVQVAKAQ